MTFDRIKHGSLVGPGCSIERKDYAEELSLEMCSFLSIRDGEVAVLNLIYFVSPSNPAEPLLHILGRHATATHLMSVHTKPPLEGYHPLSLVLGLVITAKLRWD